MESQDSSAVRLIRSVKHHIDELVVQLNLGKAEALDHVELAKKALAKKVTEARNRLSQAGEQEGLGTKLDHLRVQLALGGMESRDAYLAQRAKINRAIEETRAELHHYDERVRGDLEESIDVLQLKLNALALHLGIATLVAEDEIRTRKEEFSAQAERVAGKLKAAASSAGEEAETAAREARIAFDDIRDNLRRLFH